MIKHISNPKLMKVLRNVSLAGWLLCLLSASKFVGLPNGEKPGVEVLLFLGLFPLFIGAVIILQSRMKEVSRTNWVPVLFRGIPRLFILFYYAYFYAIWGVCFYLMMRENLHKSEWPSLGASTMIAMVLIPSLFYITSAGAYWSAAIEGETKR